MSHDTLSECCVLSLVELGGEGRDGLPARAGHAGEAEEGGVFGVGGAGGVGEGGGGEDEVAGWRVSNSQRSGGGAVCV